MTEQTIAPQSIVELIDLRDAVQNAARLNYQGAIANLDGRFAPYEDVPVAKRRQMENAILPLVCAIAGPIARVAYNQGREQSNIDIDEEFASPTPKANPYETAVNPFDRSL